MAGAAQPWFADTFTLSINFTTDIAPLVSFQGILRTTYRFLGHDRR